MCLSASSSSEGHITDLLSSDGRCVGGTSRPLQDWFNHQIETSACRYKPTCLNGFLNCLNCEQRTGPRATNGTRETRSVSKSPGLIDFGSRNPHIRGGKRLRPARLFSFPMFGALGFVAALETWSRRWANVCSFIGEFFIACARVLLLVKRVAATTACSMVAQRGINRRQAFSDGKHEAGLSAILSHRS